MDTAATTTILDLNDECLMKILKRLDLGTRTYFWPDVCTRFRYVFQLYERHESMIKFREQKCLDDNIVERFAALIGTEEFPMKTIKKINISKCDRNLLRALRHNHPEIEEAQLNDFNNEDLEALLPLPNLKILICSTSYLLTGKYIDELNSLKTLYLESANSLQPEYLLNIARYNKLLRLKVRSCSSAFSERFAQQIVEQLTYLEELEVQWNTDPSWQLIATLSQLKILDIRGFHTRQCDACKTISSGKNSTEHASKTADWGVCNCGSYQAKLFFEELYRRTQLDQLFIRRSSLTERDLKYISKLTWLKCLHFSGVHFSVAVSLAIFGNLLELEEFYIGPRVDVRDALVFVGKCQRLRILTFYHVKGLDDNFIVDAIALLRQRTVRPTGPVEFRLTSATFDERIFEDVRIKDAKEFVKIIICHM